MTELLTNQHVIAILFGLLLGLWLRYRLNRSSPRELERRRREFEEIIRAFLSGRNNRNRRNRGSS